MFNGIKRQTSRLIQRGMSGFSSVADTVGPLSFFTQWFNPNNLVGELQQLEQYKGITYACISAIAEDVAKIKFTINKMQLDGTLKPIQTHPFLDVLKNPNPTQSDFEFMEMTQTHIELTGEAFWYLPKGSITAKPKEAWLMRPDLVQVVYDMETGEVTGYIYHKWNGRIQVPLDLDEVIHFKMPNPINPYRGMGTVQAGLVYIQTEEYASQYSRNFLANNATPSGIVNFKGTIGAPEFEKVKRQWTREYGSVQNAGKTAFVRSADVNYQKIGSTLQDIDLKELKNLTRDDIMFMFRVSKPILGITEDVNYSNAQTAEYIFAKRVIDPKMNRIVDTLQTYYNQKYKDGNTVSYVTPIPQNFEEKVSYYKAGINLWLTPDEVRSAEGLESTPGGDKIRMPFNLQPIDDNTTTDNKQTQDTGTSDSTDAANKKSYGKIRIKRLTTKKKAEAQVVNHSSKVDVVRSPLEKTKEDFRKLMVATAKAHMPMLQQAVQTVVAKQRSRVLAQLDSNGKKGIKTKDLDDDIDYFEEETTQELVQAMLPILYEAMNASGVYAMELAGGVNEFTLLSNSVDRVRQRVEMVAKGFSEQTKDALVDAIRSGVDSAASVREISQQIEGVFSKATGWRAERIARTETMHEVNMAVLDAYEQSGVLEKEWYAGGADPCQFCEGLNGTIVDTTEVFVTKGGTVEGVDGGTLLADYDNVEAGDLHPNCECTIIPVTSI